MKKTLLHNLKYIIFGLVIALGVSAFAAWSNPTGLPPLGNVDIPLHTGPDQIKTTGPCTSGNCGGISVGPFAVAQNAEFDQQTFLNGMVRGGSPTTTDSQVKFGDQTHVVSASVAGDVSAVGTIQSGTIANNNSTALCGGIDGSIILCGTASPAEIYTVPNQEIMWPVPDYVYNTNPNLYSRPSNQYVTAFCLGGAALRPLQFTINYTTSAGLQLTAGATIAAGQQCANPPQNIVLAADNTPANHTQVGDVKSACIIYNGPANYQGYVVNIDPALQCAG